jgi:F-type H+-transporting ATPase subunit delta
MAELTTLARPYAKAAFAEAVEQNALVQWSDMLSIATHFAVDDSVAEVLVHPSLTAEQQATVLTDLCGDKLNQSGKNFLMILSENKRLTLLPQIVEAFEELKAAQEHAIDVTVTSAFELTDAQQETLSQALKNKLQCDVRLIGEVDQSLVGGAIIRAGDLVIDGSVRGKLAKLAEAMDT